MKFGIIGAGMIGHFHAKAITAMTGGELHSVFDLRQEAADKLAQEYGAQGYSNIEEFLADPKERARRIVHIPMGRLAEASEIAQGALFLAAEGSFATGSVLVLDGGYTAA